MTQDSKRTAEVREIQERKQGMVYYAGYPFHYVVKKTVFWPRQTYYGEWVRGECLLVGLTRQGFWESYAHDHVYFKITDKIPNSICVGIYAYSKDACFDERWKLITTPKPEQEGK